MLIVDDSHNVYVMIALTTYTLSQVCGHGKVALPLPLQLEAPLVHIALF